MAKRKLKKWQIAVIVVIVLAVIGAIGGNGAGDTSTTQQTQESAFDLSTVEGMTLDKAMQEIDDAGVSVTYHYKADNGTDTEIGSDPTSMTGEGEEPNWVVASVDGDKVYIDTPGHLEQMQKREQDLEQLEETLPKTNAWLAVQDYADEQYPYGAKIHYMLNEISAEPVDASTWSLKSTIDVTNAFGATQEGLTVEATVTGTKDAPTVTSFTVY